MVFFSINGHHELIKGISQSFKLIEVGSYILKDNYSVDNGFLEEIKEELDIIFLCNPNNPTGVLIPSLLLEKTA